MFFQGRFSLGDFLFRSLHLNQNVKVFSLSLEAVQFLYPELYPGKFFYKRFGFLGIVPEARGCGYFFLFFYLSDFAVIVKETSLTQPGVP
jgi:hypothetical protein